MNYRTLGETGLKVSEVGLGCWAIGGNMWGPTSDTEALMAIRRAVDLGVNLIDTADAYGIGHSEELIGRALGGRSDRVLIATKVGHWGRAQGHPLPFTSKHHIRLCCDASLKRLRTDAIDVYLCHISRPDNIEVFREAFHDLQERGKIWYWGVSTDDLEVVRQFNRDDNCSVVELEYNVLNRSAENGLFEYCSKHKIGTLIRSPLAMGVLTGKFTPETTFPEGDIRHEWLEHGGRFAESLERARLLGELAQNGRTMAQAAIAFVLAHPTVICVIPGAKRPDQVEANVAASDLPFSSDELARAIQLFT